MTPADAPGPLAFVADPTDLDNPHLDEAERHHLQRVLRLRPGDPLTVGDGAGRWRTARFGAELEPTGPIVAVPRAAPVLAVGLALIKGERPELAVQKLTELGIDRIALLAADRSVVRWDRDRANSHLERLRSVARSAAAQSHRAWLPELTGVVDVVDALGDPSVTLAERDGEVPTLASTTILVGPEGGWSDRERAASGRRVTLGDHVLRAETAAIAAGAVMTALRAGVVRPAG